MLKWVGMSLAAIACLAGCGVPAGGLVGVTVDAAGNPVIVVQMCEGHIDGATLYRFSEEPDDEEVLGRWEVSSPVSGFSQFDLDTGGNGWAVVGELEARDPQQRYTIYGWSNDNSWSAAHLTFSDRELSGLKPGTVLVPEREQDGNRSESLEDFKTRTCEGWF
ncbi:MULTISPECIES: hypothetical protein [unclassified Kribbella]|uniref:hypothetical protein n=1 Tax=unclassified Kribbella TaxID=2644121 RepID=UPI003015C44B